jgi:uncharacterized protein (TIGR03435 family)
MKKLLAIVMAFAIMCGSALLAQDVAGTWQGTIKAGAKDLRIVMKLTGDDGRWKAVMYSIDQGAFPIKASGVTLNGSELKFTIDMAGATYDGKLGGDGKFFTGTWTQGSQPLPLILVKATPETAWEIPEPPKPEKQMAADADPSFEVATIKPNDSAGASMQQLTMMKRDFKVVNGSLGDLIAFAFDVQMKQIVGGPSWMDHDRYDIAAVPDVEGQPSLQQARGMLRKLLADRFKLTFHNEKREMAAFVLTVGKNGQKLTPTQLTGPLPGMGMGPGVGGIAMHVSNATLTEFAGFLQMVVLDKPVVDQTGVKGKYDLNITFAPDDSQFNGHPPKLPAATDGTEVAPNLFEAVQQQVGLKLAAEKTAVGVIAIDHVEKPSAN